MSAAALFMLMLSTGQPQAPSMDTEADRTPIRCRPAPYYVAEQSARPKSERLFVTGSRLPLIVREDERRPRPPCLLMRYEPANPLRPAD